MIVAIFVLAVVVSMPIVGILLVSVASKREDSADTLGLPARGAVQGAARRVLDFHSDISWQSAAAINTKASKPVKTPVIQIREDAEDSPVHVPTSALALSPAA